MKQSQIIAMYKALSGIKSTRMPWDTTYALWALRRKLEPQYAFQAEQEAALLQELHATVRPDGSVTFPDKRADMATFVRRLQELGDMEIDLELPALRIPRRDIAGSLSMDDLDALSGVIEFTED